MRRALLAALVGVGCLGDPAPYRCDLRGGDRSCDSVAGGVCVEGSCAEPVSNTLCTSGFRYTASAATPGVCAPPRGDATPDDVIDATATDIALDTARVDVAEDVILPEDRPGLDVADAAGLLDAVEVALALDAADAPTGLDVRDVAAQRDVADGGATIDVVDGGVTIDVPDVRDVVDAPDVRDVVDVPDVSDVRDVVDAPDVRDVADVPDARDAGPERCPVSGRILSPLPNERVFGQRIQVRTQGATEAVHALLAAGIDCSGVPQPSVLLGGVTAFSRTSRGYVCVALEELTTDGRRCRTPWRRLAVMAGAASSTETTHWGTWPDFDNDGWADMLMATSSTMIVQSFRSNGTFVSGISPQPPGLNASVVALAVIGDVDGDGYGDAAATWDLTPLRHIVVYRGGPNGLTAAPITVTSFPINEDPSRGQRLYGFGDRDGDGRTELAFMNLQGRTLSAWSLDALGAPQFVENLGVGSPILGVAAGADLTGDSRPDVAIAHSGRVEVFPGGGAPVLTISPAVAQTSFGDVMASGSDTDGDGVSELIVRDGVSNALQVYRYAGGGFARDPNHAGTATDTATVLAPGDMENVALDELVILDTAGVVRVRRGGFGSDTTSNRPWNTPAGVLLAGTSNTDVTGRVWYPRTRSSTQHGIEILGMSGTTITSMLADALYATPVRLVAR